MYLNDLLDFVLKKTTSLQFTIIFSMDMVIEEGKWKHVEEGTIVWQIIEKMIASSICGDGTVSVPVTKKRIVWRLGRKTLNIKETFPCYPVAMRH